MADLLYIEASPRKERSHSIAVAREFLRAARDARPQLTVETLDLWKEELPAFDGATIEAKYAILSKQTHTPEQARAWEQVQRIIARFVSAPTLLFSVPMWNFGVPYRLKHYVDLVTQPTLTFRFSRETGYEGLVANKRAVVIYSSGGDYSPGSGNPRPDYQKPFFEAWLRFIGISRFDAITVAPTIASDERVASARAAALAQAATLAREYFEERP
ncbi:MAG TPA: NAD(P)H-dependent oxidoreductase [Steroidobacteraceae bacterium]|nr:NAD(P)H-dependent oxidoreductase [Steroidobacteraceae bacterium]